MSRVSHPKFLIFLPRFQLGQNGGCQHSDPKCKNNLRTDASLRIPNVFVRESLTSSKHHDLKLSNVYVLLLAAYHQY